jgi:anti-sigma B factor antagonist
MSTPEFPTLARGWDSPDEFRLTEERLRPAGRLLVVRGELDIATVPEMRQRLDAAIDAGAKRLVLDLSEISFMDSIAMAAILHARTRLGASGRVAVVVPYGSYTRLVFEIAGLPSCLDLYETREEAVATATAS